ncbi:NADH-dependent [FeFe] hydrogenase, group A6 [Mycoplasma sp. P36-A1]|uniref:NADH-dependent [FeFe] hydrogenase, group A6 n=1 Tax=Mycoplasma sp. P36-A1 TaxID=3252900 RepID=UPI003C2E7B9E
MVNITINGKKIQANEGDTILMAAEENGFHIPTLCHLNLHEQGLNNHPVSCRVCMVDVKRPNWNSVLLPACDQTVSEGMDIDIDSKQAINARRTVVELMLSDHPQDCLYCARSTNCELQDLAQLLNIRENRYQGKQNHFGVDATSKSIVKDLDKCILCRRCETACSEMQTVNVYSAIHRGFETIISPAFGNSLQDTPCTFCGQCVTVCPTAALTEINNVNNVWDAINDPEKVVVVQTAPAVRVAIAEEFGAEPGTISTGKMVTALRRTGFDFVFDTNWAADLTIMEEANEIISRLNGEGQLPILTSCCPAWINFIEYQFPNLTDIPSTCKSPHEMFGAITKTYFADKMGIKPENIVVVSIMPCVAKKYEAARPELGAEGTSDVDLVLTTREFAAMCQEAGLKFMELEDSDFDNPLGQSTGAAQIFGTTGGVLEAALRTAAAWLEDEEPKTLDYNIVRGLDGIKEAKLTVAGTELKVAAASGLGNARKLLEKIDSGENEYDVIEIMACPGGCIAGGGQPYTHGNLEVIEKRMQATYQIDSDKTIRESHKNPDIIKLYEDFLDKPGSHKAHELLHTHFISRDPNKKIIK